LLPALLVAEFFNSIGQLLTSQRPIELVRLVPNPDMSIPVRGLLIRVDLKPLAQDGN
jgi:hypothetical protein